MSEQPRELPSELGRALADALAGRFGRRGRPTRRCEAECSEHRAHLYDGTPLPESEVNVSELLERANAPSLPELYDEIRVHLRDVHGNEAADNLTNVQASGQHWAEHHDAGGLRGHVEPHSLHDFRDGKYVAVVRPDGVAPEDVVPTPPLAKMHTGAPAPALEETERPDEYDEEHLRALRPGSQPLPTTSDREGAHDALLRERLAEAVTDRRELGLARYHTLLQAGNGRDSLRDAVEEVLDLAAYLQVWTQARDEALELLSALRTELLDDGYSGYSEKLRRIEHLLGGGTL